MGQAHKSLAMGMGCLVLVGCAVMGHEADEETGRRAQAVSNPLPMNSRAQVHEATLHANHGGYAWDRAGTYYDGSGEDRPNDMGATDNSGRVSWKLGGYTATHTGNHGNGESYTQVTTCTYGWCGPNAGIAGTTNGCVPGDDDETEWGYSYGACNSSGWGQRFAGYLAGVDRPAGSGDMVHADYGAGASGTTTFGYHPYWSVTYNGECRTYQAWTYTTQSCGSDYVLNAASVCGDGFCDDTDESSSTCSADCGEPPACGDGTCDPNESCSSCSDDCGACPPGPPAACDAEYSVANTSSASYSDADTAKLMVELQAGVEYTFSTCGTGDSSDTYLRLHASGSQVASNDDGCSSGYRSKIVYTPSSSGAFELSMGCYNDSSCSGPVNISPGDDTQCGTGGGGGGGGGGSCTPSCGGDQCGQDDGCGGTCPSTDATQCGACGNPACDGINESGLSGGADSESRFQMDGTNVSIVMSGGGGDADLYVKLGGPPTTTDYDCRPYRSGNEETCDMTGTGTFHVMLYGYTSYSGVSLVGTDGGN